ncbi:MAG: formylglycine-generating enzyme family protein [Opitutus sp.]
MTAGRFFRHQRISLRGSACCVAWILSAGVVAFSAGASIADPEVKMGGATLHATAADMVWIPPGEFTMGCKDPTQEFCGGGETMDDARPLHQVRISGFWMDRTEVTNAEFAKFVAASHYVTLAECTPKAEDYPGAPAEMLVAGSVVFTPPAGPVNLADPLQWWRYCPGADWRHPEGPQSSIVGRESEPVVHIAFPDAEAYAVWAGKQLPTEAQWEYAARGGKAEERYTWGNELQPGGRWQANIWQGRFPNHDQGDDGFKRAAPVKTFPANGYGLYDMAGNVWEWCSDWYRPDAYAGEGRTGAMLDPKGPSSSFDPSEPRQVKRVQRGGSFLCSDQYCTRYMTGSRGKGAPDTGSNHLGFRCVRVGSPPVPGGVVKAASANQ